MSWRLSDQMYRLMAYSVSGGEANVVLPAVSYTEYTLMDMDKDNQQEIVVLNLNTVEGICQADYYDYREGQMVLRSSAPMSDAITGLVSNTKPQPGYLRNGEIAEPALFVTSSLTTGVITDIFAWRESDLVNITLNSNTGMSDGTFRLSNSISIQDINADGYLEVPRPIAFPELRPTGSAENFYSVQWMQYDLSGAASVARITYYNGEDGWYLTLPDSWQGKIALADRTTRAAENGAYCSIPILRWRIRSRSPSWRSTSLRAPTRRPGLMRGTASFCCLRTTPFMLRSSLTAAAGTVGSQRSP